MQLEEILTELENNTGSFPRLALEKAIEERRTITPILLSTLERLSNNLEELLEKSEYILHIYALYLLAQFREPLAYPVIIKYFSVPGEISLDVTGDIVTEDLGRILASVCNGDIELIKGLIENQQANKYVRGAALEALLVLVAQEVISREQIVEYYGKLFLDLSRKESDYIWTNLVSSSTELGAIELKSEIDRAFFEDLIDEFFIDQYYVNDYLELGKEEALDKLRSNPRYSFIDNVILEMENWQCFHPERLERLEKPNISFLNEEVFTGSQSKKAKKQAQKKRKMQAQSRRKNRSSKK